MTRRRWPRAEQLVRDGVKRAAADHTNPARAYYDKARSIYQRRGRAARAHRALRR